MFCIIKELFLCKKAIDFVILILYSANLLNSLIVGYSFLNECLEIFSYDIISQCNTISLLKKMYILYFSFLIALIRTQLMLVLVSAFALF